MAAAILPVAKQRLVEAGLIGASTARMKTAARWKMVGNWRLAVDGRQPPQPTFADRLAINKSASVGVQRAGQHFSLVAHLTQPTAVHHRN
ncbi:hypothetical protein QE409_000265, partial [Klebsiella sp. SORGH_AS 1173]|nr:hypothetical protein [Klebsiella sp. SORGH_AS_1173]